MRFKNIIVLSLFLLIAWMSAATATDILPSGENTFGSSTASMTSLRGDIYYLPESTSSLPDFSTLTPVGSIYTKELNVSTRSFSEGFPGVTDRFEWFAIRYTGTFYVAVDGDYGFRLASDDGSRLIIDGNTVINNDGTHATQSASGSVYLTRGQHDIEVDYFQGPRYYVALQLFWTVPDGAEVIASPQYVPSSTSGQTGAITGGYAPEIIDFVYLDKDDDQVGEWDNGMPDGSVDGHFLLDMYLPSPQEIKSILVYSADENGNAVGGQFWHTSNTGYWVLGVFDQGSKLNSKHVSSLGTFSDYVMLDLYGDDSGWFLSGNWFGVEVTFANGDKLTGLTQIESAPTTTCPSNIDLTGVWNCDDGGMYYVRQLNDVVWWYGERSQTNPSWANVAHGTINDCIVSLEYSDVPKGNAVTYGNLILNVLSNDEMIATDKPSSYGGSRWWRSGTTPGGQTSTTSTTTTTVTTTTPGTTTTSGTASTSSNPWEDPTVRSLIDEWLAQLDLCAKQVYPNAYVDKWGRLCGETDSAMISCVLTPDKPLDWDNYHYLWYNNWCPTYYPFTVQDYVSLRQSGYTFNDLKGCKEEYESCV